MGFFRKKTRTEILQSKYEKLMKEWHRLSTVNRSASDEKYAEAQQILDQIEALKT